MSIIFFSIEAKTIQKSEYFKPLLIKSSTGNLLVLLVHQLSKVLFSVDILLDEELIPTAGPITL